MQITGKITEISPIKEGTSKNGEAYKSLTYWLEVDGDYPDEIKVDIYSTNHETYGFKADKFKEFNKVGDEVNAVVRFRASEWNDKKYMNCNHISVKSVGGGSSQQTESVPSENEGEPLPF